MCWARCRGHSRTGALARRHHGGDVNNGSPIWLDHPGGGLGADDPGRVKWPVVSRGQSAARGVHVGALTAGSQPDERWRRRHISTIRYNPTVGQEIGAALLKEARRRARLTQSELGSRAGLTQSVISAYETGQRQPALSTLLALVEATGYELMIGLRPHPRRLRALTGPVGRRVLRHRKELVAAALEHDVHNLRVFGSVARGEDGPDSDIDILADLPTGMSLFGFGRLRADLESVVRARVDLVPADDLKPDARERIEPELLSL